MSIEAPPTLVTDQTQEWWRQYLLSPGIWPGPWSSDLSKMYIQPLPGQPGNNVAAVMNAFAGNFEIINQDLVNAFLAQRLQTCVGDELDLFAQDFFANDLPRGQGEKDPDYMNRIAQQLLIPKVSRNAIQNYLQILTNAPVKMMEPWYIPDSSAWDCITYWDIDNQAEGTPGLWGDPGAKYTGFIDCSLPPFSSNDTNPLWCWDMGFAWDAPSGYFLPTLPTWFTQQTALARAILESKAFGTTIVLKTVNQGANYPIGGSVGVQPGDTGYMLNIPQMEGPIMVIAQASWNTSLYVINTQVNQSHIFFSNAVPSGGGSIDWYAVPQIAPNAVFAQIPINPATVATVGGTITPGDVYSIQIQDQNLVPTGAATISYTAVSGDTANKVCIGLANAINANTQVRSIGVQAASINGNTFNILSTSEFLTLCSATVIGTGTLSVQRIETISIEAITPNNTQTAIPTSTWNTDIWDGGYSGNQHIFNTTGLPIAGGGFGTVTFPTNFSAIQQVSAGTQAVTLALIQFPNLKEPFGFFGSPGWNTSIAVIQKSVTQATVQFADPPLEDSYFAWAVQNF